MFVLLYLVASIFALLATPVQHTVLAQTPSVGPDGAIRINLYNATNETITHYWIDFNGREINYGNIPPGTSITLNTFDRHVWRIKRTRTGQTIKQFTASPNLQTVRVDLPRPTFPSVVHNSAIRINLFNATNETVTPFWINGAAKEISFGNLLPGTSVTHDTFTGEVWGVRRTSGNQLIKRFTVSTQNAIIRIEPRDLPSLQSTKRLSQTAPTLPQTKNNSPRITNQPLRSVQRFGSGNQPSGEIPMGFLSEIWGVFRTLLWLGVSASLIFAVVKMLNAGPSIIISHWHTLIENLQESPMDFYQSLEQSIIDRQIPQFRTSRIDLPESGVFSARREYLRVKRKDLIFDICAAPFGTGFFVSWWLGPKLKFLGFFYSLPIVGIMFQYFTRPWTYYKLDTALMFRDAIHDAVQEMIDSRTKANGLRALTETERKPIMRDLFNR